MVRSHWMGPVALVLATAAFGRGQGLPAEPSAADRADRFVSVQEVGKPPLRCRLLKTWKQADGSKACEAQAVDTGEMISIFQSAPANGGKGMASRIVHWGEGTHPPTGTPEAPADAVVYGTATLPAVPPTIVPQWKLAPPPTAVTAREPPGGWPTAYAREAAKPPAADPLRPAPQVVQVPAPAPPAPTAVKNAWEAKPAPAAVKNAWEAKPLPTSTVKEAPVTVTTPTPATTGPTIVATTITPATRPAPVTAGTAPVPPPAAGAGKLLVPYPVAVPLTAPAAPVTVKAAPATPVPTPLPAAVPTPVTVKAAPATPVVTPLPTVTPPAIKATPVVPEGPAVSNWKPTPASATPPPATSSYNVTTTPKAATPAIVSAAPKKVDDTATDKKPAATKADASDWHQTWGKVEKPKSALLTSAATPPVPAPRTFDPLQDPETYAKVSVEDRIGAKYKDKVVKDTAKPVADNPVKPASDVPGVGYLSASAPTSPASATKVVATKVDSAATLVPPMPSLALAPPAAAMPKRDAVPTAVVAAPATPALPPVPAAGFAAPTKPPAAPMPAFPTPALAPPPAVAPATTSALPAYLSAASIAAADQGGNAFSAPRPEPKSNAGTLQAAPPSVSMMPGYTGTPGVGNPLARIPEPAPAIAVAPSPDVVAAGYPAVAPAVAMPPADTSRTAEVSTGVTELQITLRASLYPSQREWAADRLTTCDWRANPQVIDDLVTTARTDPAPLVRVGCLRALAKMRANCEPAMAVARDLRNDADSRVRQEAEQTLATLQSIRPVRAGN